MKLNRAYIDLEIRAVQEDQRIIRGVATAPDIDRVGDILVSTGATFKNPLPLLWQHDHHQPVGTVTLKTPTARGIEFIATIPKIDEPGALKTRVDEAWQSVKARLIRSVSIGFRPTSPGEPLRTGGRKYTDFEVLELSLVTVPALPAAAILEVRAAPVGATKTPGRPAIKLFPADYRW